MALTFNYGQRAATKEIEKSKEICASLGVPHQVVELPWFKQFTQTSLVGKTAVPVGGEVSIDDLKKSFETAKAVWVPNRNGIFLNIAAGFAEGLGADFIIPGFNAEEAATFPDNTGEFLQALETSFSFSTANRIKTKCYSITLNKTQIVAEGVALKMPFQSLWPCYFAQEHWCGQCESCQRYLRALNANGIGADGVKR